MGKMRTAVAKAIQSATIDPRDAGAAALLERYADLLDAPGLPTKYRKHLAVIGRAITGQGLDEDDPHEAFDSIKAALSEQSVSSDLGPKLLAGLSALGLTLAGRGERGKEAPGVPDPVIGAHDEIKERRARKNAAASLDSTTP